MPDAAFTLSHPDAEVFVPDGSPTAVAIARTTHLAITAHADDLEFLAWPGIDACFEKPDRWFTGIVMTDGAGSARTGRFAHFTDAGMVAARREEQRAAARLGGYSAVAQLGHPSATVKDASAAGPSGDLRSLLAGMQPRIVYLHNPADSHDTHVAVFLRSIAALRAMPADRKPAWVYGCELWRDLDWLTTADKVAFSAGRRIELQDALNAVFETQIAGGKRYDLAVRGRRRAHATFHSSHETDADDGLVFAMNLTPLVADASLDPLAFTLGFIERLADDVRARFARVGGGPGR